MSKQGYLNFKLGDDQRKQIDQLKKEMEFNK